jgi:hypothetical protein
MLDEFTQSLKLDEEAPGQARVLIEPLRGSVDDRCFEAIRQVVTELVAQCVHDASPDERVEVSVHAIQSETVELAVSRPSTRTAPERQDGAGAAPSIAFQLVDRLVEAWGVREDDQRVTVWLRLRTASPTQQ